MTGGFWNALGMNPSAQSWTDFLLAAGVANREALAFAAPYRQVLAELGDSESFPALRHSLGDTEASAQAFGEILLAEERLAIVSRVAKELAQAGISGLWIKGIAAAIGLYADTSFRRMSDADLWIAPEDFLPAQRVFSRLGAKPKEDSRVSPLRSQAVYIFYGPSGARHAIDLHLSLFNPPLLRHQFEFSDYWSRRCYSNLHPEIPLWSDFDAAWITAVHRTVHHMDGRRPEWLVDFTGYFLRLNRENRAELFHFAQQQQISAILLAHLHEISPWLHKNQLGLLTESSKLAPFREASAYYLRADRSFLSDLWQDLRATKTWTGRWRLLSAHLMPESILLTQNGRANFGRIIYALLARLWRGRRRLFSRSIP